MILESYICRLKTVLKEILTIKQKLVLNLNQNINLYVKNLSEFFRITYDIYISGYTGVPKGCGKGPKGNGEWGRADAIKYWADKCNVKYRDINKYFYSVDEVSAYS